MKLIIIDRGYYIVQKKNAEEKDLLKKKKKNTKVDVNVSILAGLLGLY